VILHQVDSVGSGEEELQDQRSAHPRFRPDIEGLRAVAVVAVVLFHAGIPGVGGGYIGVDIFFVISGFLITGLLWREAHTTGTVRLRSFYGARARRLLPASAFVGVATMIASAFLLPPLQALAVLGDGITSALYVGNYWFIMRGVDYFGSHMPPSPFLHYWSLGVEEQFYLVWPTLILGTAWLIRRTRRRSRTEATSSRRPYLFILILVATISYTLSLGTTLSAPAVAFFSLPTRAWQLAVGGLIALTVGHWQRLPARVAAVAGWVGIGMVLLGCVWFTPTTPFPGVAALLPTVGATLLIGAGCTNPVQGCGRILGLPPMRAIGRISYSWYLWHWPVLILAPALLGHPLGLAARLTAALLSAGLAWLTLRYVENPLRFRPTIRNSAGRSLGLGAAATAVAVSVGLVLQFVMPNPVGHGAPAIPLNITATAVPAGSDLAVYDAAVQQTFAQVHAGVAASLALKAVPSNLQPPLNKVEAELKSYVADGCLRTLFQSGQPDCASGDTASTATVAVVGDSHAGMWTPAFRQLAAQRHWRLETLGKGACPIMDLNVSSGFRRLVEFFQHCEQWRAEIMARLRSEHPKLVVISVWRGYGIDESLSGFHAYDQVWLDSLTDLTQQLRDIGANVLVLGPIPDPHHSVPICVSAHLDNASACALLQSEAVNDSGIAAETAATTAGGGQYADLTNLFCAGDRCPAIVGNSLVYIDDSHLTFEYSRQLAPAMAALIDRALAHSGPGRG
jgi:peptidoglycan/LPS O-acetylase OafA/YrhL